MKKIIAFLLAMLMLLSLASCSEEAKTETGENENSEAGTEESLPEERFTYIRGTVDGNVYSNEYTGISFEAPEGWVYFSDEEIAEIMGVSMDYIFDGVDEKALEEIGIIYDMYCVDYATGNCITVNSENMILVHEGAIDETYYLTLASVQVAEQLSGGNVKIIKNEPGIATIATGDVPCIYISMEFSGTTIHEAIIAKKTGSYMTSVTVGAKNEEDLKEILSLVSFK